MASEHGPSPCFDIHPDGYRCISLHSHKHPNLSTEELEALLSASIKKWTESGIRGLWVKVAIADSHWVPVCTKLGLVFHHAKPKYVMLKGWIHPTEVDTLPDYSNQYLGAAGFVVNDNDEVLVVQERFHTRPHWKLPGGHANPGEDIGEAATREVLEETGVHCCFQHVICFRHQHQYRYGCSDFYFICLMRALSSEITADKHEIKAARWMKVKDYAYDENVSEANRFFAQCYLSQSKQHLTIVPKPVLAYTKDKYQNCYCPQIADYSTKTDDGIAE